MIIGNIRYTRYKDKRKRVRTILEIIILLMAFILLIHLFFHLKSYHPYDPGTLENSGKDTGFVALSYFGVDRIGDTSTLIGEQQLRAHLQALKDQGYVTISSQDIENYYTQKKPLPKKALYLMFEDGRRDTAIFAQNILEDLNYRATMFTYPEKFIKRDPKFLMPVDLKDLSESTYWDMGTNGYRLQYINVFDRYHNYIGEIDPLKYAMMQSYLGRYYNHFLMDYIRDKDMVPKESYRHMESRVSYDYERLRDVYTEELGYVPRVYTLMHSNTSQFGNNNEVSSVNEKWIRQLFALNFNREGYCFNRRNSSVYDLTRMQPQPYWPVNHLLMRIKYDINQDITFITGDKEKQEYWSLQQGASEIKQEKFILTTLPQSKARVRLKNSGDYKDLRLSVRLEGNALGTQEIYLRSSEKLDRYILVSLSNGDLIVAEKNGGATKELYRNKIDTILHNYQPSIEEDKRDAEVRELQTFARYADSQEQMKEYLARADARSKEPATSIDEGAEPYKGTMSVHSRSDHDINISLKGNTLQVLLDGQAAAEDVTVSDDEAGWLCLGADWKGSEGWSQRNLADDVYDGVFEKLIVRTNTSDDPDKETVLFSAELTGWEKVKFQVNQKWESLLNWFLKHL